MNRLILMLILFSNMVFCSGALGRSGYSGWFTDKRMRFDFLLSGNHQDVKVIPVQVKEEPVWAGSRANLTDTLNYGTWRYQLWDTTGRELLFSRGFANLFQEWQTTAEAKHSDRAFYQAVFFPYPKQPVMLKLAHRDRKGEFEEVFATVIDPDDIFINRDRPEAGKVKYIQKNGPHHQAVDLVFLSEGYTENQQEKFFNDVGGMAGYLFSDSPFKEYSSKFNIAAVWAPSADSGTDVPGEGIWQNTRFNSTFYTFGEARYLTTSDMKQVYDAAAGAAWDHLVVLVNSERYGGGGFYNFLSICTSDHNFTRTVLTHEFGHAFAGLADEYYTSSVAYQDFYPLDVEPWEPNITTLVYFSAKWAQMVPDSIPVPTPRNNRFANVTGVFEGGGYQDKGIYSPAMDCRMKSVGAKAFCEVCQAAITRTIKLHCD